MLRAMGSAKHGRAQAVRDLRRAREVFRFAAVFAAMIVVPAIILSYFALSAIQYAEASADAEMRSRAEAMTEQVAQELRKMFGAFEIAADERLKRQESLLDNLGDLSPYLRGVYRFDRAGNLVAPFQLEAEPTFNHPPADYAELVRDARKEESKRDYTKAAALWDQAAIAARHPTHEAEAQYGSARAIAASGDRQAALKMFSDVATAHPTTRHSQGFLVKDLALHKRAELTFVDDNEAGATALFELVDDLLDRRWTVGYGGEVAIATRALDLLTGAKRSPDKVEQARARLNERADQLHWAEGIKREIGIIDFYSPDGRIKYITTRGDSPSVWAIFSNQRGSWAFSFAFWKIYDDLQATVASLNELEREVVVEITLPDETLPKGIMTLRAFGAPMESVQISVRPADPEGMDRSRQNAARTRRIVILVAVFMVLMGVVFSARIISREVENARVKADFAANVSHELRSPITQIRLKGEALQYGLVDPGEDMQNHFDAIVREAERLSRLVDNVLDFAAIERGAKTYHLRPEDMIAVVWNTAEAMRATIEGQGLTLEVDVPDDLPPIWMDREAIAQVIINLMSNAAKYGSEGKWIGVYVRLSIDGVDVSVADRGIGMTPEDAEQIFEHFYRSTDPKVRKKKGTGIGLTIVRYIVEAHGGTIVVDSAPNRGSTFTITFPLDPPEGHGAPT